MDNLPPLPEPATPYASPMFSADQMHAYARAALQALEDEVEASLKEMIDKGLGQVQPVAWQAIGGSIWNHKTRTYSPWVQRQTPFTDSQIDAILDHAGVAELPPEWDRCGYEIARAIEAAHGIK